MSNVVPFANDPAIEATKQAPPLSKVVRESASIIDAYLELDRIAGLAIFDPKAAMAALKRARTFTGCDHLRHAILYSIVATKRGLSLEHNVQGNFFENLDSLLPGAVAIKLPMHPKHRPDGFVRLDGRVAPVEVKCRKFDGRALGQLLRYMRHYGSEIGIAVAPKLGCALPANITFVAVTAGYPASDGEAA